MANDDTANYPCSPSDELDGLPYFPRMCEKIRSFDSGTLPGDLHDNLGLGMDLWTCQFLGIEYDDLKAKILSGSSDSDALAWARETGLSRPEYERTWWIAFMKTVGFRDRLSAKLEERKVESGLGDRDDILTMFDYIDADESKS